MPLATLLLLALHAPPVAAGAAPPSQLSTLPDAGGRLLWGFGGEVGLAEDRIGAGPLSLLSTGGGLYLRLGYELDDRWGFEGEVSGASWSLGLDGYLREALTADFTPVDGFTVAFGPLLREGLSYLVAPDGVPASTGAITGTTVLGGTVRADLHLVASRNPGGRSAVTFGAAGDLGASLPGSHYAPGPAFGAYLMLGYAHY